GTHSVGGLDALLAAASLGLVPVVGRGCRGGRQRDLTALLPRGKGVQGGVVDRREWCLFDGRDVPGDGRQRAVVVSIPGEAALGELNLFTRALGKLLVQHSVD